MSDHVDEIGTVETETRDGKVVVLRADPHILVSAKFLDQYDGATGDALVLPGGYCYRLGEWDGDRRVRHARLVVHLGGVA